jgi:hypothetical protein
MTVELTEREIRCILSMLDNESVKGRLARRAVKELEDKLECALSPRKSEAEKVEAANG